MKHRQSAIIPLQNAARPFSVSRGQVVQESLLLPMKLSVDFLHTYTDKTIAVISVDPSKKKTGGALLGDRIRMNSIHNGRAYMRSLATRESDKALSGHVQEAIDIVKTAGFDFIILESAGVGQSDASILDYCDVSMYVMTPEYGAAITTGKNKHAGLC